MKVFRLPAAITPAYRLNSVGLKRNAAWGRKRLLDMNIRRISVLIIFFFGLIGSLSHGQEITVAAAADLQGVMPSVIAQFQKETGKNVKMTYGSSGNFFQQLQNGAPFDMFFSANLDYPRQLESAGLIEPGTFYQYATGKIVIWVANDSKLDISSGLPALTNPAIKKIAVANPEHAPYGKAAVAALKKENVYDKVSDKLVLGENISQTASFVVSGAADVGIVALSLALSPNMRDKGRYVEIPAGDYPAIEQACVVLKSSGQKDTAQAFLKFIKTPAVGEMFRAYGFALPGR
jgi:molybdate transport system substrate-binding protein